MHRLFYAWKEVEKKGIQMFLTCSISGVLILIIFSDLNKLTDFFQFPNNSNKK